MKAFLFTLLAIMSFAGSAKAYPGPESFRQTCTINYEDAYTIDADCLTEWGGLVHNVYQKQTCYGALGNINGYITCTSSNPNGGGGWLPPGSYLQTCSSCHISGSVMSCNCLDGQGGLVSTWIHYKQCNKIGNINGRLVCY